MKGICPDFVLFTEREEGDRETDRLIERLIDRLIDGWMLGRQRERGDIYIYIDR